MFVAMVEVGAVGMVVLDCLVPMPVRVLPDHFAFVRVRMVPTR